MLRKILTACIAVSLPVSSVNAATYDKLLSLVIDVSGSVDSNEYTLQMEGYAEAFRDQDVRDAILGGENGGIAVNVVQFAGIADEVISFTSLTTDTAILDFADALASVGRLSVGIYETFTYITAGIDLAASTIDDFLNDNSAAEVIIDLSGDGFQNAYLTSELNNNDMNRARDAACGGNVDVINTIAIEIESLEPYFENQLRCGDDSFGLYAESFTAFSEGIKTKILSEVESEPSDPETPAVPVPLPAALLFTGLASLGVLRRRA